MVTVEYYEANILFHVQEVAKRACAMMQFTNAFVITQSFIDERSGDKQSDFHTL